ncbi:MAG: ABC-2 type transporter [Methanoregulaceae archaeon PtaU1.Bin059]|nr:MAG: ABC-2 type transporter [Methanoregulaceae archaeon PtaB.Bin152]OPY39961.1 MAG: ABC-2 type transporter [Methanoregulaceae archaeon PtaU1.Bin059]
MNAGFDRNQLAAEAVAAWAIAKKDMIIYYLKPNIIIAGLLFPLFMFLAFAAGKNVPLGALIPGLISVTILFSSSSIEPVSIPIERRTKTFERLLSAPVSLHAIVVGESLSGFLYSIGIALVPLVVGIVAFGNAISSPIVLTVGMLLSALCFSTMGTLFAAYPTESPGDIMSMLNLVRLPLIFVSGTFIPLDAMPTVGKAIAYFSPLTYGNDLIQYAYGNPASFNPLVDVAMLVGFFILFQIIAHRLYAHFNE